MAINILTNPSTSAPAENDDWTYLYNQVTAGAVPQGSILTDWESTTAAPDLKQGAFIRYEGNLYQVQTENYTISGSVSAGVNYIVLTLVGTTLTAAWVTDISDYSYDAAYGGMYNTDTARKLLLPDLCYLDGTEYNRGKGFAEGLDVYRLANGNITSDSLIVSTGLTVSEDISIGGICVPTGTEESASSVLSDDDAVEFVPKGFISAEVFLNSDSSTTATELYLQKKSTMGLDYWYTIETYSDITDSETSRVAGFITLFSNGEDTRILLHSTGGPKGFAFVWYKYF